MIDIKKIYEDAVMAADGASAPSGIVATPDDAVGTTDVLGTCDHTTTGGYMHDGCFHLPTGSEKIQSREILAGKKKKNHKNDYVKGMKVTTYNGK